MHAIIQQEISFKKEILDYQKYLQRCITNNNFSGIDRIVPVGRAFDIGPIWDGYDIIYSLSRIVGE